MNVHLILAGLLLFPLSLYSASVSAQPVGPAEGEKPVRLLIEAEDLQFPGGWKAESYGGSSKDGILRVEQGEEPAADAMAVIEIPVSGTYRVWSRSWDHDLLSPGTRQFLVLMDGTPAEKESGGHGKGRWTWEKVGTFNLEAGEHALGLRDSANNFARCDAILLTNDDLDPSGLPTRDFDSMRIAPKKVDFPLDDPCAKVEKAMMSFHSQGGEAAHLENDRVRLVFDWRLDGHGQRFISRRTQMKSQKDGSWQNVAISTPGQERLFLLNADHCVLQYFTHPRWRMGSNGTVTVQGKKYEVQVEPENPYRAERVTALVARAATQIDPRTVRVDYEAVPEWEELTVTGTWTLDPGRQDAGLSLAVKAPQDGFFSVGFAPFQATARSNIEYATIPLYFHHQRVPRTPTMLVSAQVPHPMAILQTARPDGSGSACLGVAADPASLPFRWANRDNSPYGFTLSDPQGKPHPTVFSPVLGLEGSQWKKGEEKKVNFRVLSVAGTWTQAMEYFQTAVMDVRDYRHPVNVSLTETALNIIDLIAHPEHSGWDAELGGFYNIEQKATATHASPLTLVSAAILTRDEKYYAERALPTIEFTLTRNGAHFGRPGLAHMPTERLTVPTPRSADPKAAAVDGWRQPLYGTAYWQGLDFLTGHVNPWMREFALEEDGQPRYNAGYSNMPRWSETLAAWRLDPTPERLAEVCKEADAFIEDQFRKRSETSRETEIGYYGFANASLYPYWWDLVDLFEITGEGKYLDAMREGAFYTLTALWGHPVVPSPDATMTVHAKGGRIGRGELDGEIHPFWTGTEQFRLGFPRKAGDLPIREVPAWEVAQVGLTIEVPHSYFHATGAPSVWHVMNPCYAAALLRAYGHTGKEIFRTNARNSIIGRFANYPGYYLGGFTDLPMDPEYPRKGPDLTDIYYHHVPVQLALTIDYLVAQAEVRSAGKIQFPYAKQQGYAWFINREYGVAPGKIYDDPSAMLWLERDLVKLDTPDVDWLAARGPETFHVILMSQSKNALEVPVDLNFEKAGIARRTAPVVQTVDREGTAVVSKGLALSDMSGLTVQLPPMGMATLSFPARSGKSFPDVPHLEEGHKTMAIDPVWGSVHAFRIRSPFGKDALYVALEGGPPTGGEVTFSLRSPRKVELVRDCFPYEFSIYPLPMDAELTIDVKISPTNSAGAHAVTLEFPGKSE
ncbi:hypothetical protein HQ520_15880 [bacterium]|nr:hypothetical protein [bacterium]